jgi:hypothetical protein
VRFLSVERATLDEHLPGLDKQLEGYELAELETPGSDARRRSVWPGVPACSCPSSMAARARRHVKPPDQAE